MKYAKLLLSAVCLLLLPLTTALAAKPAIADRPMICDGIIVKFKIQKSAFDPPTQHQLIQIQAAASGTPAGYRRTLSTGAYLLRPASGENQANILATIARLNQHSDIEYAECDARQYPMAAPNDTRYVDQWYLHSSTTVAGAINAETAWDIQPGDASTVIAVLDTGIADSDEITAGIQAHPDIDNARILPGYDFITLDTIANDGDPLGMPDNGRDADPRDPGDAVSADECGSGEPAENSSWHGTFVSGILIATSDNASFISGVDHAAQLLPVRVLGKCGGDVSDISDAIRWAAGLSVPGVTDNMNPADVINLSLGGGGACTNTQQSAINDAVAAGAVVVVAAGNESSFVRGFSPANCNNVITVAASTREGGETVYTNVGPEVDISAPGGNDDALEDCGGSPNWILSTSNDGDTSPGDADETCEIGTSFATPLVAGAAALVKADNPTYTVQQIRDTLIGSARAFPTGTGDGYGDALQTRGGSGILDIEAALVLAGTGGADVTPDSFSFSSKKNVSRNATVTSNSVTINGINAWSEVVVANGEYSINGAGFTSQGSYVKSGDRIRVRLTASNSHSSKRVATLQVGSVSRKFTVTTEEAPEIFNSGGSGGGSMSVLTLLMLTLIGFIRMSRNVSVLCRNIAN